MADIVSRVKFIGDAQQLLSTYKAIGAQAAALQRQIDAANRRSFNAVGLQQGGARPGILGDAVQRGPLIKNVRTEIDSLNKTLKIFGDTAIRTGKFGDIITGSFEEVRGRTDLLAKAAERYGTVVARNQPLVARAKANYKAEAQAINQVFEAQRNVLRQRQAIAATGRDPVNGQFLSPASQAQVHRALQQNIDDLDRLERVTRANSASMTEYLAVRARAGRRGAAALGGIGAALDAPPLEPASVTQLRKLNPGLLRNLQRQGLGITPDDLYRQGASFDFEKNLVQQTTRIKGAFTDLGTGIKQSVDIELDKAGKQITRFGGHLSGLQNFLTQTTRNLQKVVQWGLATTAVFGSLAFAARELGVLTELNQNLTRLGITANLTQDQTNALFTDLADIGIRTATPLTEITASADDIALAVREAGKSTEDYLKDITNLTEAVGIYTNLTGTDTVEATDLLVSSMKQLGLETEDVTSLLSKITAVAGGQSTAISDITEGLAAMAEAATNAGLSVDRTIATVQILSQVTAKSPSEIATAFKNLVGALENPAGIKQLKALNIDLISQGNNIIDIYKEIATQIRTGAIEATEVSGILRNLAGGPRRAPDAAALLSNIDKIAAAEARSARASNEALIANAKILDTIGKKVTQLQAKFDKLVFQKFSPAFEQGISALIDVLGSLLDIIGKIPTEFIATGIQIALFLTALRLGVGVGRAITGVFVGMSTALKDLAASYGAAAIGAKTYANAQQLTLFGGAGGAARGIGAAAKNGLLANKGALGVIGAGAAVGAVAGGALGGGPLDAIAGALSTGGLAALTAPVPLPWLKLGGAIALAAGTFLTFATNSKEAADSSEDAAQQAQNLLQIYEKYKEASFNVSDLKKQQKDLAESIDNLNKKQPKTAEDLAALEDAQRQYVSNTLQMVESNVALTKSMEEIRAISPDLARAIQGVRSGSIRPEVLEQQIKKLQLELLKQTDSTATIDEVELRRPNAQAPITPYQSPGGRDDASRGTLATTLIPSEIFDDVVHEDPFNLIELEKDANKVKYLFDETGKTLTATFEPTGQNIGLVAEAIQKLREANDPLAASLQKTFDAWVDQNSLLDSLTGALGTYQNRIDALKFFNPEQAAELQKILDLTQKVITTAIGQGDGATAAAAGNTMFDILTGKTDVKEGTLTQIERLVQITGLLGDEALSTAEKQTIIGQALADNAFDVENLGFAFENTKGKVVELTDEMISAMKEMDDFVASTAENAATASAELQGKIQGGEFKGKEGKAELSAAKAQVNQLKEIAEAAAEVNVVYQEMAAALGGELDPMVQEFAGTLTEINGLQDAASLSTGQLIERMFSLADTYGLTGAQTDKLGDKLVNLFKALKTINDARTTIKVGASVDVSALIKMYKALNKGVPIVNPFTGFVTGYSGGGSYDGIIAGLQDAQNTLGNFGGGLSNLFSGGGGSTQFNPKGGGSKKSKSGGTSSGPDVSTLDLPEEIANAFNRDALIKEAIRRAKALQKQIPGASAEGKNDIVTLLKGTQKILEVRGVKDDLLRKALEELAEIEKKRLEFETKADAIRRIRVGAGDFAAIANVPVNSKTGVGVAGNQANVTLNLNGTILTPAQLAQFADLIAAALKRQIAN